MSVAAAATTLSPERVHLKACPVCAASGSLLVHETAYPEARYPGTFVMRRCAECGLLFNSPRLDDAAIARLYDANYYFFREPPYSAFRRIPAMWRRTVGLVRDQVPGRHVLEIGSAKGYLLAVLRAQGWTVQGVELSRVAARFAAGRLGVPTWCGTVEAFAGGKARGYDLVLAIDVLEHALEPWRFVEAATRLLRPGGLLIVDTPNGQAANIDVLRSRWGGFNPFHIFLFSSHNLGRLVERAGLEVVRAFSYGNAPASAGRAGERSAPARALASLGLMPAARSLRYGTASALDQLRLRRLVARAARAASGSYLETADAAGMLSAGRRGDNIVVIARKRA